LVKLAVGFAESQTSLISQNLNSNSPALRVSHFLLIVTSHPDREIVELTFEFWCSLAGRVNGDSADQLFLGFMDSMISKLEYPEDYDQYGNFNFNFLITEQILKSKKHFTNFVPKHQIHYSQPITFFYQNFFPE
jgi:hypothetical protein